MRGVVTWYHPDLRMALVELPRGFAVGALEEGDCAIGDALLGEFRHDEVETLRNERTNAVVVLHIEAERITEEQANDLLALMQS